MRTLLGVIMLLMVASAFAEEKPQAATCKSEGTRIVCITDNSTIVSDYDVVIICNTDSGGTPSCIKQSLE